MKILVTGASGFLGYHIVRKLLENDEKYIRCFIRQSNKAGNLKLLSEEFQYSKIELFEGNLISKDDAAEAVKDIDIIYHCAASLRGAPSDMFINTVITSKNLLDAIANVKIQRVVHISSFSVYGVARLPKNTIVNEQTPLEDCLTKRDLYSYVKYKQEKLFRNYQEKYKIPLVVIRPGVIYGPGGAVFSTRVGVKLPGLFLHLGNNNLLPLTYVENCADAIVIAGKVPDIDGEIFNIHDDDLPTSRQYLKMYQAHVKRIRNITIPYFLINLISVLVKKYHDYSKGQLPDILTPYKTATHWKGNRFDNSKLKNILGWKQDISTKEGLKKTFTYFKKFEESTNN